MCGIFRLLSLLVNFHEIVVSGAVKTGLSVSISLISYLILLFQDPFLVSTHCGALYFCPRVVVIIFRYLGRRAHSKTGSDFDKI